MSHVFHFFRCLITVLIVYPSKWYSRLLVLCFFASWVFFLVNGHISVSYISTGMTYYFNILVSTCTVNFLFRFRFRFHVCLTHLFYVLGLRFVFIYYHCLVVSPSTIISAACCSEFFCIIFILYVLMVMVFEYTLHY